MTVPAGISLTFIYLRCYDIWTLFLSVNRTLITFMCMRASFLFINLLPLWFIVSNNIRSSTLTDCLHLFHQNLLLNLTNLFLFGIFFLFLLRSLFLLWFYHFNHLKQLTAHRFNCLTQFGINNNFIFYFLLSNFFISIFISHDLSQFLSPIRIIHCHATLPCTYL